MIFKSWLWIKGKIATAQKRFCVWNLEQLKLYVCKSPDDQNFSNCYDLSQMESITESADFRFSSSVFPFQITTNEKILSIAAPSEFERKEWIRVLSRRACTCRHFNIHRMYLNSVSPSPIYRKTQSKRSISVDESKYGDLDSFEDRLAFIAKNRLSIAKKFQTMRLNSEESDFLIPLFESFLVERQSFERDCIFAKCEQLFFENENPFSSFLCFFQRTFKVSYFLSSVISNDEFNLKRKFFKTLRNNAVDDILSITHHIKELFSLRYLRYNEAAPTFNPENRGSLEDLGVSNTHILYHAILRCILKSSYSTIFALFRNENYEDDEKLAGKYAILSKATTETLGISPEFCLDIRFGSGNDKLAILVLSNFFIDPNPFQKAIDGLLGIKTVFDPDLKLKMIHDVSILICECIDKYESGHLIDANDVIAFYSYLVLKSEIPDLHAEISFVSSFMPDRKNNLMEGYYLSKLPSHLA
jgi:hypothetical protein